MYLINQYLCFDSIAGRDANIFPLELLILTETVKKHKHFKTKYQFMCDVFCILSISKKRNASRMNLEVWLSLETWVSCHNRLLTSSERYNKTHDVACYRGTPD